MGHHALEQNTEGFANTAVGVGALGDNVAAPLARQSVIAALSSNVEGQATWRSAIGRSVTPQVEQHGLGSECRQGPHQRERQRLYWLRCYRRPGESSHTYIRNIDNTSVSGGGTDTVTVNLSTGLLGHLSSSRRHKEQIQPMANSSEALYRLKPVSYRYKKEIDSSQALDYGLVAEEVAEIDPNLTACNREGQIESVRYNAINAMLLNEFERTSQERGATS